MAYCVFNTKDTRRLVIITKNVALLEQKPLSEIEDSERYRKSTGRHADSVSSSYIPWVTVVQCDTAGEVDRNVRLHLK